MYVQYFMQYGFLREPLWTVSVRKSQQPHLAVPYVTHAACNECVWIVPNTLTND